MRPVARGPAGRTRRATGGFALIAALVLAGCSGGGQQPEHRVAVPETGTGAATAPSDYTTAEASEEPDTAARSVAADYTRSETQESAEARFFSGGELLQYGPQRASQIITGGGTVDPIYAACTVTGTAAAIEDRVDVAVEGTHDGIAGYVFDLGCETEDTGIEQAAIEVILVEGAWLVNTLSYGAEGTVTVPGADQG